MTLGERRSMFTRQLARLIERMVSAGYQPRLDEVGRPLVAAVVYSMDEGECGRAAQLLEAEFPRLAHAIRSVATTHGTLNSVHIDRLAADIQLWRDGAIQGAPAFTEFGHYWEGLGPLFCWGGRFRDPGHFSVTPDGVRK